MENIQATIIIVDGANRSIQYLKHGSYRLGRKVDGSGGIALQSHLVSDVHGRIIYEGGAWLYVDENSREGTYLNGQKIYQTDRKYPLNDGAVLRIEKDETVSREGVMIYFIYGDLEDRNTIYPIPDPQENRDVYLGRDESNDICLNTVSVSRHHGMIWRDGEELYYRNLNTVGGTFVNGKPIQGAVALHPKYVLMLGNVKVVYDGTLLICSKPETGTFIEINGLTREVTIPGSRKQKKKILTDVTVSIAEKKLVAILGGSGAGKTTFMNCVMGYEKATGGMVSIDGMDHLHYKEVLRQKIGYVPQDDLLRDNLSVYHTLEYAAKLRLTEKMDQGELRSRIDRQLDYLGIAEEHRQKKIRKLSGGQRKRISIANELIADPPIIFLDEPTSGLDPKTETDLMHLLKDLTREQGKTLLVVTHTIQNIMLFDQVLFFGRNGVLKFSGSPQEALDKYGVKNFVDIYDIVDKEGQRKNADN